MSSHHIVREKQEPALFILSLNHFDADWLGQLLEWSPTVIATAATVFELMARDIHVDWLLTQEKENPTTQANIDLIYSLPDACIKTALEKLIAKGYPAVNIVTDDLMPGEYQVYLDQINIVIYHHRQKVYAVKPGFEKWKPAGSTIQVLNPSKTLQTHNLLTNDHSTYIVETDGLIKLIFEEKQLLIAEEL